MAETALLIGTIVSGVAGAAGTVASISAQNKAASQQKKSQKLQQQQQDRQVRQERRAAIRRARIARATSVNVAAQVGGQGGSGIAGGLSALSSNLASGLGFQSGSLDIANRIGSASSRAIGYSNQASLFSSIADLGFQGFNALGGFRRIFPQETVDPTGANQRIANAGAGA